MRSLLTVVPLHGIAGFLPTPVLAPKARFIASHAVRVENMGPVPAPLATPHEFHNGEVKKRAYTFATGFVECVRVFVKIFLA